MAISGGIAFVLPLFRGIKGEGKVSFTLVCPRLPIFPARLQASIVGTTELNFCVRNGNRWTLCVNNTNLWCTSRDSNPGPTD